MVSHIRFPVYSRSVHAAGFLLVALQPPGREVGAGKSRFLVGAISSGSLRLSARKNVETAKNGLQKVPVGRLLRNPREAYLYKVTR